MVKAIVGANWGDEGKGKITDMLAKEADIIVRFQGTPLSTIMANLHCIRCRPVFFIIIPPVLSEMVWH